ncbi:carbamoyl phosphate synthase small subunit, partial [Lactobacillus sp. XV13L]|nr:carbamoyl phosphate synthase small subunit [Lactobacillus sp. XV13L]
PLFGICLGHQLFALANGADTYKLKFGHRGFNHPVRDLSNQKIVFTSQNHGYAVSRESLTHTDLQITHEELNDHTVEGLRHQQYPAFSVQFHPDAAPGPHDAAALFDYFIQVMTAYSHKESAHDTKN